MNIRDWIARLRGIDRKCRECGTPTRRHHDRICEACWEKQLDRKRVSDFG